MNAPPVGSTVQFFPHGLKSSRQPYAAIVTESGGDGQCKLNLQIPGGGQKGSHRLVRHFKDPWVMKNLTWLAGWDGSVERGVWDWVPGFEPRAIVPPVLQECADEATDEPKADRKEVGRQKVRQWADEGMDAKEIASKVRSWGLTRADVDELLGVPA